MKLSRREFVAGTILAGLSLRARAASTGRPRGAAPLVRDTLGTVRHVHAEIGPGPWSQDALAERVAAIAATAGLGRPAIVSVLGEVTTNGGLPAQFVATLDYTDGPRLVIAARRKTADAPAVTFRGANGIVRVSMREVLAGYSLSAQHRREGRDAAQRIVRALRGMERAAPRHA